MSSSLERSRSGDSVAMTGRYLKPATHPETQACMMTTARWGVKARGTSLVQSEEVLIQVVGYGNPVSKGPAESDHDEPGMAQRKQRV
jgi:hypothetical protein